MKGVQILSRSGRLCRLGLSRSCATQNANANPEAASSIVVPGTSSVPSKELLQKATVHPLLLKPYVSEMLNQEDYFKLHRLVRVDEMFEARLHYGHKIGTLNENMKWALYGERLGVCIFDLDIAKVYLQRALDFIAHVSYRGGLILFISTHRDTMFEVEKTAQEANQYSHVRPWLEGSFTNLKNLLGDTPVRLPDLVIFMTTISSLGKTHPAVIECAKMAIPTVAVVDSNSDPAYHTYLVPANDDSLPSVRYLLRMFKEAMFLRNGSILSYSLGSYIRSVNGARHISGSGGKMTETAEQQPATSQESTANQAEKQEERRPSVEQRELWRASNSPFVKIPQA
ncbi:hypothetical protein WR25_22324 [Diploscapter pachys]|uniref:Ribosomal protein S2 n=1 Tax=Diploscapter pachys TaxID=2018661 RepID=A0A2A2L173_9BILA|nr:hypothetical protein WR25_22324 [Diploscapter pachys]